MLNDCRSRNVVSSSSLCYESWLTRCDPFDDVIPTMPISCNTVRCSDRQTCRFLDTPGGGGHSTFFQVGVCGPDFRSVGLANWHLPLKRGACERKTFKFWGLWAENFQIWGLVSWKFPNLGACELKLWWKLRLLRLNFPNFLKRGSCELTLLLEMGPLRAAGEAWKGGLQGRTSRYPLSRSVPPPPVDTIRPAGFLPASSALSLHHSLNNYLL